MRLHVTNGDSASEKLGPLFPADKAIPWRDALHDGPVPPGLTLEQLSEVRAAFIGATGWAPREQALREFAERDGFLRRAGEFEEVVLWFEHDLYDQLQLIQILDALGEQGATNVSLVQTGEYLGPMPEATLTSLFPSRKPVTRAQFELAREAWAAFRSPDPRAIEPFFRMDARLPFLAPAFVRWAEDFPWTTDGLTRTERTIATLRAKGVTEPAALYRRYSRTEHPIWMGDSSFFLRLEGKLPPNREWRWNPAAREFVRVSRF